MDQIYPDEGLLPTLNAQLKGQSGQGLTWDLWTENAGNSDISALLSNLTLCSAIGAAAAIFVPFGSFSIQTVIGHVGTIQAGSIQFRNISGAPLQVRGYAIYDVAVLKLEGFAVFDSPITVPSRGYVPVVPVLGTYSGMTI